MKSECCVCHREAHAGSTLTLSPEEKKAIEKTDGKKAPDTLFYCKPCYRILSDKERGAQFLRGMMETGLRQAGVVGAETKASKFHRDLLSKVAKVAK